jgi:BlaI family penicillinase repressor
MAPKRLPRLGDLQLAVLKVLWDRGQVTIADVQQALGRNSRLAYVTIATVLRRLEARGLVRHKQEGRKFIYRAAAAEEVVTRNLTARLLDHVFAGSVPALVNHLLSEHEVDERELVELERIIAERRRQS